MQKKMKMKIMITILVVSDINSTRHKIILSSFFSCILTKLYGKKICVICKMFIVFPGCGAIYNFMIQLESVLRLLTYSSGEIWCVCVYTLYCIVSFFSSLIPCEI